MDFRQSYCKQDEGGYIEVIYNGAEEPVEERRLDKKFPNRIYRAADAQEAVSHLQNPDTRFVIVEGGKGSGKSSVVRTVLNAYPEDQTVYFNGHLIGSVKSKQSFDGPPRQYLVEEVFARKVAEINQDTKVLAIDSSDYLYQHAYLARVQRSGYDERCRKIIEMIERALLQNPGLKLIMTVHDQTWSMYRADLDRKELYDKTFRGLNSATVVPSSDLDAVNVARFFYYNGFSWEEAKFIAEFSGREDVLRVLGSEIEYYRTIDPMHDFRKKPVRQSLLEASYSRDSLVNILNRPSNYSYVFINYPQLKDLLRETIENPEDEGLRVQFILLYTRCMITTNYQMIYEPFCTMKRFRSEDPNLAWGENSGFLAKGDKIRPVKPSYNELKYILFGLTQASINWKHYDEEGNLSRVEVLYEGEVFSVDIPSGEMVEVFESEPFVSVLHPKIKEIWLNQS